MKKTIKVSELKDFTNEKLQLETISDSEKKALCFTLEHFLAETDNYHGYVFTHDHIEKPYNRRYL